MAGEPAPPAGRPGPKGRARTFQVVLIFAVGLAAIGSIALFLVLAQG